MKKTNKVIGILLALFMLMQTITVPSFATDTTPKNVHWGTEDEGCTPGTLVFTLSQDDKNLTYGLIIQKSNIEVERKIIAFADLGYNPGDTVKYSISDTVKEHGGGVYSVSLGTLYEHDEGTFISVFYTTRDPYIYLANGDIVLTGYFGIPEKVNYALDKNGTLTISGTGDVYSPNEFSGTALCNLIKKIVIEPGITSVSSLGYPCVFEEVYFPDTVTEFDRSFSFDGCENLNTVSLGNGITEIPEKFIRNCPNIKAFNIPDSVTKIGKRAFESCGLESIVMPDSVTEARANLFYQSTKLKSAKLSASLKNIEKDFFSGCTSLESLEIPNKVETIGDFAFNNTNIKSIYLPDSVTSVGKWAFPESIEALRLSPNMKTITERMSYKASNLANLTIPEGVEVIGEDAFGFCTSLKKIVLPHSVKELKKSAFSTHSDITESIYIPNKDCVLADNTFTVYPESIVIYCVKGSAAEEYAKKYGRICKYIDDSPDFIVNGGIETTDQKTVNLLFNHKVMSDYTKYKINNGKYIDIKNAEISFDLDTSKSLQTITITFLNASGAEITVTHSITYIHKHKLTYVANGETADEFEVGCGAEIPATGVIPTKEGYIFVGWNGLPKVMPDSDVTVNAIFAKVDREAVDAILTDEEKASCVTVNVTISSAAQTPNIPTEIAEKYSIYTASITLNIELSKGKDDVFEPVTATDALISFTIDIPTEIQNKTEYIIIREHGEEFDVLSTTPNADGEYIEVKDNTVIIHAKKFSAYMLLAKDTEPTPARRGGGGGGSSTVIVRFETNGAPSIKNLNITKNSTVTAPTAPEKDGFVFDGWYTDKGLTKKFDFSSKVTSSVTLYAKWIEKEKTSILLTIGKTAAEINGKTVENDVAPKIVNNRTMLPIRFIAENLGAKVGWTEETQTVTVTADAINISLVIGDSFATVNGEKIELDSPSFTENDRTYLPIRFISERLGADVQWDEKAQTVSITK